MMACMYKLFSSKVLLAPYLQQHVALGFWHSRPDSTDTVLHLQQPGLLATRHTDPDCTHLQNTQQCRHSTPNPDCMPCPVGLTARPAPIQPRRPGAVGRVATLHPEGVVVCLADGLPACQLPLSTTRDDPMLLARSSHLAAAGSITMCAPFTLMTGAVVDSWVPRMHTLCCAASFQN